MYMLRIKILKFKRYIGLYVYYYDCIYVSTFSCLNMKGCLILFAQLANLLFQTYVSLFKFKIVATFPNE